MSDTEWAKNYILDPLNAPAPNEETGLNTHFRSTFAPVSTTPTGDSIETPAKPSSPPMQSRNPFRSSIDGESTKTDATVRTTGYPSPPSSASYRKTAFASVTGDASTSRQRQSLDSPRSPKFAPTSPHQNTRSRGSSLGERFPGDQSGKPLDIIRRESKRAAHPPHLRRHHIPGADIVDRLDATAPGGRYHHEGPFDAALLARNTSYDSSPVAAVHSTNAEAIRATPRENIMDSMERHIPLAGTAVIPPGEQDRFGRVYQYREGENLMTELGGNYKRWPGVDYKPDDYKGKGEPSFSLDKAFKEKQHQLDKYGQTDGVNGSTIEMMDHPTGLTHRSRGSQDQFRAASLDQSRASLDSSPGRSQFPASAIASGTSGVSRAASSGGNDKRKSFEGLKKRIVSLGRHKD